MSSLESWGSQSLEAGLTNVIPSDPTWSLNCNKQGSVAESRSGL
jgi:hypothetical protein